MIAYLDTSVLLGWVFRDRRPLPRPSSLGVVRIVSSELLRIEALRQIDNRRQRTAHPEVALPIWERRLAAARGIDPKAFFSRSAFLGYHEAALLALHEGKFDAAATYQGALPDLLESKGIDPHEFRIIAKTAGTPHNIYCARAGLEAPVVAELRRLFLEISVRTAEGRKVLNPMQINGFIPADDRLFDGVRAADAAVNGQGS